MGILPAMRNGDGIRKRTQVKFGGYDHNPGAGDGTLWDMKNLSGDHFPLLGTRARRAKIGQLTKPNGLYAHDGLFWVDGTGFYADGELRGQVEDSRKVFASLLQFIVIFPDKKYYDRNTGAFGSLEETWNGSCVFRDGTYAGQPAEGNEIYREGADWGSRFHVGDAVFITGCSTRQENNRENTAIIQEIDGDRLRFYRGTFTVDEGGTQEESVTISRRAPDLDFICENENRLWGCRGDEIYASKLGDVFNWNVFQNLSTDSYHAEVDSAGDFTGCCSFLGYPVFFKEEHIYKVYGSKPTDFQVMGSADLGVARGSGHSIAIAGETLFYLSRAGIAAYSGGIPQSVGSAFGRKLYRDAVGGSDGIKYYVSMEDEEGESSLFVYDTKAGLWHREDETRAVGFCWADGLYLLDDRGGLTLCTGRIPEGSEREEELESFAEFSDFTQDDPNKKGISKLHLRMELEENSRVTVLIQFDSCGEWQEVSRLTAEKKRSFYLPIIPRRCDHFRLKIEGSGEWKLYSLSVESYSGSAHDF